MQSAKVDYDKSGRSNGTATVVFARRSDAFAAVKKYNGVELEGKILSVTLSAAPAAAAAPKRAAPAAAKEEAPRLVISTVNDRFQPRGRGCASPHHRAAHDMTPTHTVAQPATR